MASLLMPVSIAFNNIENGSNPVTKFLQEQRKNLWNQNLSCGTNKWILDTQWHWLWHWFWHWHWFWNWHWQWHCHWHWQWHWHWHQHHSATDTDSEEFCYFLLTQLSQGVPWDGWTGSTTVRGIIEVQCSAVYCREVIVQSGGITQLGQEGRRGRELQTQLVCHPGPITDRFRQGLPAIHYNVFDLLKANKSLIKMLKFFLKLISATPHLIWYKVSVNIQLQVNTGSNTWNILTLMFIIMSTRTKMLVLWNVLSSDTTNQSVPKIKAGSKRYLLQPNSPAKLDASC